VAVACSFAFYVNRIVETMPFQDELYIQPGPVF